MVRPEGLEPPCLATPGPEPGASTSSATAASSRLSQTGTLHASRSSTPAPQTAGSLGAGGEPRTLTALLGEPVFETGASTDSATPAHADRRGNSKLVPSAGLEPASLRHSHLKTARLPVSPRRPGGLGRSGGARTHDIRFWRPALSQLSYTPAVRPKVRSRKNPPLRSSAGGFVSFPSCGHEKTLQHTARRVRELDPTRIANRSASACQALASVLWLSHKCQWRRSRVTEVVLRSSSDLNNTDIESLP